MKFTKAIHLLEEIGLGVQKVESWDLSKKAQLALDIIHELKALHQPDEGTNNGGDTPKE